MVHATGAVVGRGGRHEFLQGVPRLAPSGKDIRDGFYGRRSHLSEFYIASRLSLNSLPLSFEKISCFVQLPDKLRHNNRQGADRVSGSAGNIQSRSRASDRHAHQLAARLESDWGRPAPAYGVRT